MMEILSINGYNLLQTCRALKHIYKVASVFLKYLSQGTRCDGRENICVSIVKFHSESKRAMQSYNTMYDYTVLLEVANSKNSYKSACINPEHERQQKS